MSKPLVSAIIPAYNRPRQTQRAIDSVSEQTYPSIELVLVDDGSESSLRDELTLPGPAVENVVVREHEKNRGGNVARNTGIENASGEYLAFLDSDDEWHPEKIQRQMERLTSNEAYVSYTGIKQLNMDGDVNAIKTATHADGILDELVKGNSIGTFSSVVVEADAVDRSGKPNPNMPCWQDWEWYLRMAAEGLKFDAVEDPLTIRHNEGEQISRTYAPKRDEAYPVIKSQIKNLVTVPDQRRMALSYLDFHLGSAALINQHYSEARQLFVNAIRGYPKDEQFYVYLACAGPHFFVIRLVKRLLVRIIN
jgi:glycosyltransferase involved in cell wall biosynthesis